MHGCVIQSSPQRTTSEIRNSVESNLLAGLRLLVCGLLATTSLMAGSVQAAENNTLNPSAGPGLLDLPTVAPVVECSSLSSLDVSKAIAVPTRIISATSVSDDKSGFYCKVQVSVDEYARLELHLPASGWTQRLLFGGGFGQDLPPMFSELARASWQDLGNRGHEDAFANNNHARVDFAYRGMHLQVLAAKAIIARYYNQAPKFSYYNACSEPGREGMMEVQRFPEDFDGVAAGCPPINDTINNGIFYAWNILQNTGEDGKPIITADKLPILHEAVLTECDAADGAKDRIISDPLNCHPRLTGAECKPGQNAGSCLSSAQIHAALELYKGAHDENGGKLTPIGVLPGSELSWTGVIVPVPPTPGHSVGIDDRTGTLLAVRSEFSDPSLPATFRLSDLKFDRAAFDALTKLHYLYDATDPDLSTFAHAGHKLILWQSLGDTNVLPAHAILYYSALQRTMGAKVVDQFVRFYLLPGVYHCGGGDGPAIRDFLTPLMAWVERGVAPGALIATHLPGALVPFGTVPKEGLAAPAPDLTRPVYPYPNRAQYVGSGNVRDANRFVKGPAHPVPSDLFNWFGSEFYTPGYEKWCTTTGAILECTQSR
jgi:feruloyl esterase